MYKKLGYAKHNGGEVVWQIVKDNKDGTVDLNIDDLQGDMTLWDVDKKNIELVEEKKHIERISKLQIEYDLSEEDFLIYKEIVKELRDDIWDNVIFLKNKTIVFRNVSSIKITFETQKSLLRFEGVLKELKEDFKVSKASELLDFEWENMFLCYIDKEDPTKPETRNLVF